MKHLVFAYLDPGTGSLIIQMIIASVVGVFFVLKNFWKKVMFMFKGFLHIRKS